MLMPRLRNRLFALAAFFGLLIGGGIASAPAALADELNMDQSSAPAALASNANIPGSVNPPLGARTATPVAPVLASTETPALARTGLSAQTVSLVAVLTASAGVLLLVLARRRQEK
ncbi:hypothetical protein [Mobiluncus sp.]|uniref:hypothetical protein n=1 Tax=Mobiluncus sp. TaxID=47293 RepID=UPI002A91F5F2|nr:hypothetical protein [Mobiluncus sp.]MDY6077469.1 hypothetical protein [Mobiluncus sp.]